MLILDCHCCEFIGEIDQQSAVTIAHCPGCGDQIRDDD